MTAESSACVTVGKGGVGESGGTSVVTHIVAGPSSKMIVLRNVSSNLCPNTGAIAVLVVNGKPEATGNISIANSSIQIEAPAGSQVAAIVNTIPLFNGIVCVRLGELSFTLNECDLVAFAGATERQIGMITSNIATRDWYAWNNLMPPKPDDFHVVGEIQVPNPGVEVFLIPKSPQGINPKILLLDLVLVQQAGLWPQLVMWKQVRYDKVNTSYERAQVLYENNLIVDIPVDTVV